MCGALCDLCIANGPVWPCTAFVNTLKACLSCCCAFAVRVDFCTTQLSFQRLTLMSVVNYFFTYQILFRKLKTNVNAEGHLNNFICSCWWTPPPPSPWVKMT